MRQVRWLRGPPRAGHGQTFDAAAWDNPGERRPSTEDNMPSVHVSFPAALTSPEPPVVLDCEAGSVAEALRAAVAQAPRYAERVFYGDRLLVSVVVNDRHVAPAAALATTLSAGDRVEVMPPVAGG
jgi:molybdopterin converting factor small subunit